MGTFDSFRKAYGALKDSTKVQLVKINSEFKDLDIAIVKATNHVECPPAERHIRRIFSATSVSRSPADVAYCIHALSSRLSKTGSWIVAIKIMIVIHRTLREGDATFREELLNHARRGNVFQLSNFKDDSSPLAWDCSAWVRTYALFLEERLECFRTLKYDIEAECLTKSLPGASKVHSRTRLMSGEELLENLPALQQLLYRLVGCQPEGAACHNYLVQYALALVLKESFKVYCAINDGIINLVDLFFDMHKHNAVKALNIYKRAVQQNENLADFYDFSKCLDLARNFQFPKLREPPPSFLATMEEYIKEAPQIGSLSHRRLEYEDTKQEPDEPEEPATEESEQQQVQEVEDKEEKVDAQEEREPKKEEEIPPLIAAEETGDLLGLNELNPKAAELEESNALALAIIQPVNDPLSRNGGLSEIGKTPGWELALVTTPSNNSSNATQNMKLGGGFDKLLLDSLYEDDASRRQIQMQHAGYNTYGYGMPQQNNPFELAAPDPFSVSNTIAPPANVQMAMMQHQQQIMQQQQLEQQQQNTMMMVPQQSFQNQTVYAQQQQQQRQMSYMGSSNPFGDSFSYPPQSTMP